MSTDRRRAAQLARGASRPQQRSGTGRAAGDRGDVILGWLTRVVVTIVLVTSIGFDGLSIGLAHISSIDDADTAAIAASHAWLQNVGNSNRNAATLAAADEVIAQHGEALVPGTLSVASDGTASLELQRQATTVLVHRLGPLRSWADISVKGHGRYQAGM